MIRSRFALVSLQSANGKQQRHYEGKRLWTLLTLPEVDYRVSSNPFLTNWWKNIVFTLLRLTVIPLFPTKFWRGLSKMVGDR